MAEAVSDATLLRRAGAGDAEAFAAFMRRHRDSVWRYLHAVLQDHAAAVEAFHTSFLAARRGAAAFDDPDGARVWMLTIARDAAGPSRHADDTPIDFLAREAGWGDAVAPDLRAGRSDTEALLQRALGTLDAEDRELIVLRDLENIEPEAVATLLGITVPAMRSRLHRTRLRLVAAVRSEVAGGSSRS